MSFIIGNDPASTSRPALAIDEFGISTDEEPDDSLDTCSESKLNAQYEAGKQYCIDNPADCGIEIPDGEYTQTDLDAKYQEGLLAGRAECDNPEPPSGNCASFDFITNLLHIPCLDTGAVSYWLDMVLQGKHLVIKNSGQN